MIPCRQCAYPCGIEDASLIGNMLWYRCPECRHFFEFEEVQPPTPRVASKATTMRPAKSPPRTANEVPGWEDTTPLLPVSPAVLEHVFTLDEPGHDTPLPMLDAEEEAALLRLLPRDGSSRIRTPSVSGPRSSAPPPRRPTPMTFAIAGDTSELDAEKLLPTREELADDSRLVSTHRGEGRAYRMRTKVLQGFAATAAMLGLALMVVSAGRYASTNPIHGAASMVVLGTADSPPVSRAAAVAAPAETMELDEPVVTAPVVTITSAPTPPPEPAPVSLAAQPAQTPQQVATQPAPVSAAAAPDTSAHGRTGVTDSEMLAASADRAQRSGDVAKARALYRQVLADNPSYLPARLGMAQLAWDSGDRDRARAQYRAIVNDAPSALVPEIARQRAREAPESF